MPSAVDVMQRSAFGGRPMVVCSATRTATVSKAESLGERTHGGRLRIAGRGLGTRKAG